VKNVLPEYDTAPPVSVCALPLQFGKEGQVLLEVIVLGFVVIGSVAAATALVASYFEGSRASDRREADHAWTPTSFDDAIRDHLRLKGRHAALRDVAR
jgi:hypothetical protein